MIRIVIIAVILAAGAVMFLPQTAAMFPSVDAVIGTATSDISNVLGGVVNDVRGAVAGAAASAIESATGRPAS